MIVKLLVVWLRGCVLLCGCVVEWLYGRVVGRLGGRMVVSLIDC